MTTIDQPIRFPGTVEEASANFATHHFMWDDEMDSRCMDCDCKLWHAAASYPCGAEVPRETVTV